MDKQIVIEAFKESILNNKELAKAIFGTTDVPEQINDTILAISSLDFVDLMINVENRLNIEFAECMLTPKIRIDELAQRIADYV